MRREKATAALLRRVADGELTATQAPPELDAADSQLAQDDNAYEALLHFEQDQDVRRESAGYAEWQAANLRRIADRLERAE